MECIASKAEANEKVYGTGAVDDWSFPAEGHFKEANCPSYCLIQKVMEIDG